MKIKNSRSSADVSAGGPIHGVTAQNYLDNARSFIRARGAGFVIRALDGDKGHWRTKEPSTEAQWHAWVAYFGDLGVDAAFARFHGCMTVPTEWPEDFDVNAQPSDRRALLPRRPPRASDSDRRLGDEFRKLGVRMVPSVREAAE